MKRYLWQNALALDQLANTLLGGYADETLSSRAYRADQSGRPWGKITRPLIDTLFFWQTDHCHNAWVSEVQRRHLPDQLALQGCIDSKPLVT